MTDGFDDDALRDAIGSHSGGPVDTGSARRSVMARARRTRVIRGATVGGATALVLMVGLALFPEGEELSPVRSEQPVSTAPTSDPAPSPSVTTDADADTPADTTTGATTEEPAPSSTAPATTEGSVGTTTDVSTAPPGTGPSNGSGTSDPATTDPGTTAPPATAGPTSTPAPSSSSATTDPTPSDAPFTRRYDSAGGSITVDWDGVALTLVSVAPSGGYETEIEDQSASRVRVRFRGEDDDSRIEIRADDGQVTSDIS